MTTAVNRGDAIDLMVQGMTPPAQCVTGQGDLLVSNGNNGCWPNEFGPTTLIYPLDLGKSQNNYWLYFSVFFRGFRGHYDLAFTFSSVYFRGKNICYFDCLSIDLTSTPLFVAAA